MLIVYELDGVYMSYSFVHACQAFEAALGDLQLEVHLLDRSFDVSEPMQFLHLHSTPL